MENKNEKVSKILKILAILIVIIALAIIIDYVIKFKKFADIKKSYSELKLQYEEDLKAIESYKENVELKEKNKQEKEQRISEKKTNNAKKGNLDINSELVQNLYSKILQQSEFGKGSFYKEEKTTIDNLTNEEKVFTIIQNLKKETYIDFDNLNQDKKEKLFKRIKEYLYEDELKIEEVSKSIYNLMVHSENELMQKAKEIFGNNIRIEFMNNLYDHVDHHWEYIDGDYFLFNWRDGGGFEEDFAYGEIQYAIEDNEYIYIFDKFVYEYNEWTNDGQYTLFYRNADRYDCIGIKDLDVNYEYGENIIDVLYDDLYMYKHTFKKDNNGKYYWISTEKYIEN